MMNIDVKKQEQENEVSPVTIWLALTCGSIKQDTATLFDLLYTGYRPFSTQGIALQGDNIRTSTPYIKLRRDQ